ncbi:MAG: hypothetical protein R2939_10665, partial [Kofleriaceae bacterium]
LASAPVRADSGEPGPTQVVLSSYSGWGEGSLASHLFAAVERVPQGQRGLAGALRAEVAWLGDTAGTWHVDLELGRGVRLGGDGSEVALGVGLRHARNLTEVSLSFADEIAESRTGGGFIFGLRSSSGDEVGMQLRFTTHLYGLSGAGFDFLGGPTFGRLELGLLLRLDTVLGSGILLGGALRR